MISAYDVLDWLNASDGCSHLDEETNRLIKEARRMSRSKGSVKRILEVLRNTGRSTANPLQAAEISLHRAAVEHYHHWFSKAASHAKEAVAHYKDDDHRRAIALWILGMSEWEMHENHDAYRHWNASRELFQNLKPLYRNVPTEQTWYKDRIWQMEIELAARPEENWAWLNCFEAPSLSSSTQQIVESVQENIRQRSYPNVYVLIQDLYKAQTLSKEAYEKAEVYLEFGLAVYEMGNIPCAIDLLRKSVVHFFPGNGSYHKQVVARCMLGALEWLGSPPHNQAVADWTRVIEGFDELMMQADWDRNPTKKEWYRDHRDIVRAALSERLTGPTPAEEPTQSASIIPDPEPSASDLYTELLQMAKGDRALAERLIEHERTNAPHADRNELIRRAIERWRDDNR